MTFYFAYGSNLNQQDRERWCFNKGTRDFVEGVGEVAFLPDHELVFHYYSHSRQGGALDIKHRRGQLVEGALFKIKKGGWRWLDQKEGIGAAYQRKNCTVLTVDGRAISALTYEVIPGRRESAFVEPGKSYPEIVAKGLIHHGLGTSMLDAVANNRACGFVCPKLFVYGTLLKGQRADFRLGACLSTARSATVAGQLWNLGRYPGLSQGGVPNQRVKGEIVTLADPELQFEDLDHYEEFSGYGQPNTEYFRGLLTAQSDAGEELVWTYQLSAHSFDGQLIESGDWLNH
jgi:gamma-glutamylcyclotransferase (GGCT)/AIG2-like uncharacterized protein YtfP